MCGIFGAIGKHKTKQFKKLAIANVYRGKDSCGFYNGEKLFKAIGTPMGIDYDKTYLRTDFLLGHTRCATHGKVTLDNQHPFQYGNIIGAHNGIIDNFDKLKKKYDVNFVVDSQIIFYLINEYGVKSLKELEGSFAIWYTDIRDETKIYLFRNNGNPLSFCKLSNKLLFTSDSFDFWNLTNSKINDLPEGQLMTINIKTLEYNFTPVEVQKQNYYKYNIFDDYPGVTNIEDFEIYYCSNCDMDFESWEINAFKNQHGYIGCPSCKSVDLLKY